MTIKKFGQLDAQQTDERLQETPVDNQPEPLNIPKPGPRNPLPVEKRPV